MRALGAITIKVFAFVFMLLESSIKHLLRLFDLHTDLRQIGQLHRRAVFIYQSFYIKSIEFEDNRHHSGQILPVESERFV
jgi:hypothetical protein